MATEAHREFSRRQHRIIGNFLALQAWVRGADCIVLERAHLEAFLGLERFKRAREKWLLEDLQPWFPNYVKIVRYGTRSLASLFLSRLALDEHFPKGAMGTAERVKKLDLAIRTCVFKPPHGPRTIEASMVAKVAMFAAGLSVPSRAKK